MKHLKLAVIGLGYVGLPLAVEFGKKRRVIGFDIDSHRIDELRNGWDRTLELTRDELKAATGLKYSYDSADLTAVNCFIIAVPTPIDNSKAPDLRPLIKATEIVSKCVSYGDIIIYESTVYPGATEEICVPIIEKGSGLEFNEGFYLGYSPERINPGDKEHNVTNIIKITSGSTPDAAEIIDELYREVVLAGTYRASSIKVAEAAKVIENSQRDINIAFVNELAIIFSQLKIDTREVLAAAGTKWNFLNFEPGLVGGHCIGVDPYYLTHKSILEGYHPEVLLAGRRINDGMSRFAAVQMIKLMASKRIGVVDCNILILGVTFKENCPDARNTKVVDIADELSQFGCCVDVYDPVAGFDVTSDALRSSNATAVAELEGNKYDGIIIAVKHRIFCDSAQEIVDKARKKISVIYDLKCVLSSHEADLRL